MIKIGEWWRGLSSLGKLEQNKFQTLTNVDIHDEIGIVKPQLAMVSESTTPNEACVSAIDNSGNVYFCSTTTGKIWKRTTAGSYSLVHTNTNTAHRGCRYFNGYLWYWTPTLGGTGSMTYTSTNIQLAVFWIIGKNVYYVNKFIGTTGGEASFGLTFTLPVPLDTSLYPAYICIGNGAVYDALNYSAFALMDGSSATVARWIKYNQSNFGLGTNRTGAGQGFYTF